MNSIHDEIERRIRYRFKNASWLARALVHSSFSFKRKDRFLKRLQNNEVLEFLGDAVLDLAVTDLLVELLPDSTEGELARLRSMIVKDETLAEIAKTFQLGEYLILGEGEVQTGGREKVTILASTLEALIGAIRKDGGFEAAAIVVRTLFLPYIQKVITEGTFDDSKTRLQEWTQKNYRILPQYIISYQSETEQDKLFQITVQIGDRYIASAFGRSKKEAEQMAARYACALLELCH